MIDDLKKILDSKREITLSFKINPGSSENKIKEIMDNGVVKVNITSAPEKGKANKEFIKFVAKYFSVDKNNINIISGETSKLKLIKIKK